MGDRITITITDGERTTPQFYGHWCGLSALKYMNDLVREKCHNGIHSLMCNFLVCAMGGEPQPYSYYIYNTGEADTSADWDNYDWTLNLPDQTWTTTFPEYAGKTLSLDDVDRIVKQYHPELYKED